MKNFFKIGSAVFLEVKFKKMHEHKMCHSLGNRSSWISPYGLRGGTHPDLTICYMVHHNMCNCTYLIKRRANHDMRRFQSETGEPVSTSRMSTMSYLLRGSVIGSVFDRFAARGGPAPSNPVGDAGRVGSDPESGSGIHLRRSLASCGRSTP